MRTGRKMEFFLSGEAADFTNGESKVESVDQLSAYLCDMLVRHPSGSAKKAEERLVSVQQAIPGRGRVPQLKYLLLSAV